jgi:ribosome-associated protein
VSVDPRVEKAAHAALGKKALDVVVLDVRRDASFTDYFLIVSGTNQKQLLAIADAILDALREEGILLDYDGFVVHIFTPRSRSFYDLERLWGGAVRREIAG